MDGAPRDEGPCRPVPQPPEEHRRKDGDAIRPSLAPDAEPPPVRHASRHGVGDGQEQVITKPRRQRDVPARPELADVAAEVRVVEVDRRREAERAREADGHVRVAGEVAVDLRVIEPRREDQVERLVLRLEEHRAHVVGEALGNHHLLEQAPEHQAGAAESGGPVECRGLPQLRDQVCRPFDGPREDLRKESDVKRKDARVAFGLHAVVVHVQRVANELEDVERDPNRHQQVERLRRAPGGERSRDVDPRLPKEIEVFEEHEGAERHADIDREQEAAPRAGRARHRRRDEIHDRAEQDENAEDVDAERAVEPIARGEERDPAEPARSPPGEGEDGEAEPPERGRGERHAGPMILRPAPAKAPAGGSPISRAAAAWRRRRRGPKGTARSSPRA